jgi:3-oxoacyl-[acyl-carrier protein] reductase
MLLDGQAGLVTGAAQGLGQAIAVRLAGAGAKVIVNDINGAGAEDTVSLIHRAGGTAVACPGDISVEDDVVRMVGAVSAEFGVIDFACNNAIPAVEMQRIEDLDHGYARKLADVILVGTALCMKHELRALKDRGGAVVNISSTAHLRGQENTGFYAGCKAGIEALTRVAANESGGFGIRVNAVQAGAMLTPALRQLLDADEGVRERVEGGVPLGRIGEPDEIAGVVLFLLSDLASYLTGAVVTADGGGLLHGSSLVRANVD